MSKKMFNDQDAANSMSNSNEFDNQYYNKVKRVPIIKDITNRQLKSVIVSNDDEGTHVLFSYTGMTTNSYIVGFKYVIEKCRKNQYKNVNDFIVNEHENITRGIIKKKASKLNNQACIEIVKNGYKGDSMYFDLCQEVALILLENKDYIINNNGYFDISNVIILCYRLTDVYLTKNRNKKDITRVDIVDYNEENNNFISMAINSKTYRDYLQTVTIENEVDLSHFKGVIESVKIYLTMTEKKTLCTTLFKVLDLLVLGTPKKDILKNVNVSHTTLTKYCDIIKNAYWEIFKPIPFKENTTSATNNEKEYIKIDFKRCNTNTPIHNEYKTRLCDIIYRKELALERIF